MNPSNKPTATRSDHNNDYQNDCFVVDWACINNKSDKL